jgi:hypothetical protein
MVGLLVLLGGCAAAVFAPAADSAKEKKVNPCEIVGEPGGTLEAAGQAATDPDEYAWQLFLFINRQAKAKCAGVADPDKTITQYDPDTDVVWESWALTSSEASEVFHPDGSEPVAWDKLIRNKPAAPDAKLDVNMLLARQRLLALDAATLRSNKPLDKILDLEPGGLEVRMNRATFDKIREEGWYNRAGLKKTYDCAKATNNWDLMQFPAMTKVIKAAWSPITDPVMKERYHWRTIGGKPYALVALHVITKDLRQWFWCDFVHADIDRREPVQSRDSTTRGPKALHGQNGIRDNTVGSKWANYRLKGSQIAFTGTRGEPTDLGNAPIEGRGNVASSSCITCHATAVIGIPPEQLQFDFLTGLPSSRAFVSPSGDRLLQSDFLWALPLRAGPKKPASN